MSKKQLIWLEDYSRNDGAVYQFKVVDSPEGLSGMAGMMISNIDMMATPPGIKSDDNEDVSRYLPNVKPGQIQAIIPPQVPDIAVCKIDLNKCHPKFKEITPVDIISTKNVEVGTPIGILGFPQGLNFPHVMINRDSMQLTPLLQTGVISGILPFNVTTKPENIHCIKCLTV